MYGLIGKMTAVPGQRDALAAILLDDRPDWRARDIDTEIRCLYS